MTAQSISDPLNLVQMESASDAVKAPKSACNLIGESSTTKNGSRAGGLDALALLFVSLAVLRSRMLRLKRR